LVVFAERGREIGLGHAAKGVIGERRLVAVRVGDDVRFRLTNQSQKPHLSRGVTDVPPGSSKTS
jgi:hypothetical protein